MLIQFLFFYCSVNSNLIVSNTFDSFNNIILQQDLIQLTIWLQVRFKIMKLIQTDYQWLPIFRIADQYDNEQVDAIIELYQNHIDIRFKVQNEYGKVYQIEIDDKQEYQWIKFHVYKNKCFNQIASPQGILFQTQKCMYNDFDQILFFNQVQIYQILFYDNNIDLDNQETEYRKIYNFPQQKEYFYIINNHHNLIQILAFVQFQQIQNGQYDLFKLLNDEFNIIVKYTDKNLMIFLQVYDNKNLTLLVEFFNLVDQHQWMLIDVNYVDDDILLQFHVKELIYSTTFKPKQYQIYFGELQKSLYLFQQLFQIINGHAAFDQLLLISRFKKEKDIINFCYSGCQKCNLFQCEDELNVNCSQDQFYNVSSQKCQNILDSSFYEVIQSKLIKKCEPNYYLNSKQICQKCPQYQGHYFLFCNFENNTRQQFLINNTCLFQQITFQDIVIQIIEKEQILYQMYDLRFLQNCTLHYEDDFNIYLNKAQDPFLIYSNKFKNQNHCELGYHRKYNCKINLQNCQFQNGNICLLCKKNFSLLNNRCIKCQQNCQFCFFQNKKVNCILFQKDYYINQKGLIHKCNGNKDIICQSQDDIKQFLQDQGAEICQDDQIYQTQNQICVEKDQYSKLYYLSELNNLPKMIDHKLEIQDLIKFTTFNISQSLKQINILINLQQIVKLSTKSNKQRPDQQFFIQTQAQQQNYKLILDNITVYLGYSPIVIIYQGQAYLEIIHIYDQKIKLESEKVVQFNILIIFQSQMQTNDLTFESLIQYENSNKSFIYNFSFLQSPLLFLEKCFTIKLKANQIILSGINIQQYEDQNNCNSREYGIYLVADIINISNIIFYKANINELFYIFDFQVLDVKNIYFLDSQINKFINALSFAANSNQLSLLNVVFNQSIIHDVIEIINIQIVEFINLTFINSTIKQNELFKIFGSTQNITINQLWIINSIISRVIFFQFESWLLQLKQIQLENCTITNTSLIFSKSHVQFIESILVNELNIEYSEIFRLHGLYSSIQNCYFNLPFAHFSSIFKLDIQKDLKISNVYMKIVYSNQSLIFDTLSFQFNLNNFNIQSQNLFKTKFLYIKCDFANIQNVLIGEQTQMVYQEIQFLIDIRADVIISIINLKIFNYNSIESGIMYLISNQLVQVKNFIILNALIDNQYLEQLIMIKISKQTLLQNIRLRNLIIYSKIQEFSTICFFGREANYSTIIENVQASNIKSDCNLTLIQNEFSKIQIEQILLRNLQNVSFIRSHSVQFSLKNCHFNNIYNFNQNFALIAILIGQEKSRIALFNIFGNFLETFLLYLTIIDQSNIHLKDFHLQNCFQKKQEKIFSIVQETSDKQPLDRLKISRIYFYNQPINYEQQGNLEVIFYIQFQNVVIENLDLINCKQQFILLVDNLQLQINNLFIFNSSSLYSMMEIRNSQQDQHFSNFYSIIIVNIIVKYQLSTLISVFSIMPIPNQNIMMKNVHLFEIKAQNSILINNNYQILIIHINQLFINHIQNYQNLLKSEGSQLFLHNCYLLNSQMLVIFNNQIGSIIFKRGFIIGFKQKSNLFKSQKMIIQSSEIVDSNTFSAIQNISLIKSYFSYGYDQLLKICKFDEQQKQFLFLSLNEGNSFFEQRQISSNIYQVHFSESNFYLYLPSGRDIGTYKYFDIKKLQYQQIYKSISIINKNYNDEKKQDCILQQSIDDYIIYSEKIQLEKEINILNNITFTLNPLSKDKFIQFDVIYLLDGQNITLRTLVKTFNCQLGEYLYQNQCLQCDISKQYYSIGYNQKYCQINHLDQIQDLKVGQIKLLHNYWRYSYAHNQIEACENKNCLGGWQTGDKSCQIGYIGAICNECDINDIRGFGNYGKIYDTCQICYFDNKIYIKGFCLILWQLLLVYISYYSTKQQSQQHLFLKISQRKFKEILINLNVNQITILIQLFWNYLFTIYLLKDVLSFGYKIDVSLNFIYNPNISTIPQQDCLINNKSNLSIQYTQLLVKTIFPIFLFNLLILIYLVSVKISSRRFRIYVIIVSLISIYQQNQLIILQSLLKLSSKVKYSNIWWTLESLAVQFYSRTHQQYLITIVIPLITLFIICNLVACFWISYVHKKRFTYTQLSIFIYIQYKRSIYYWDYLRYIYIYIFMILFYFLKEQLLIIIITLIFSIISLKQRPFVLRNLNEIDQIIWQFSIFSFFSILVIQKESRQMSLIILLISNLILIYQFLQQFIFSWNIQYKRSLVIIIQRVQQRHPILRSVISIDRYLKTQYYFQLLKQGKRKSECSLGSIIQTQSSYQQPANSCDIELIQLRHEQN